MSVCFLQQVFLLLCQQRQSNIQPWINRSPNMPSLSASLTQCHSHSWKIVLDLQKMSSLPEKHLFSVFSIIRRFLSSWKLLLAVGQRPGLWTPPGKFGYGTSKMTAKQSHTDSEWKQILLLYCSKWLVKLAHPTQCRDIQRCLNYLSSTVDDVTEFQHSHMVKRQAFWCAKLVLHIAIV